MLTLRASSADKPKIPILLFADSILGIQPYDWQCKILLNYKAGNQTAAACANFTGKTSTLRSQLFGHSTTTLALG